jgi:CheY-like chemotaxis protein
MAVSHYQSSELQPMSSLTAGFRVLIVEADPAVRQSTELLLRVDGYQVASVATLAEALHYVQMGNDIELVVSDHYLSNNETGIQVITALRGVLGMSLPAILMTRDTATATQLLASDHNVRIVTKPFIAEKLLALLRS